MNEETFLADVTETMRLYYSKPEDIVSIIRQDDVDSLMSALSTNAETAKEYVNSYDQSLLHIAGRILRTELSPVAQYDAINCVKYLVQQNLYSLKEDAVAATHFSHLDESVCVRYGISTQELEGSFSIRLLICSSLLPLIVDSGKKTDGDPTCQSLPAVSVRGLHLRQCVCHIEGSGE